MSKRAEPVLPTYSPPAEWAPDDQISWARALTQADPLEDPGLAAHWSPETQKKVERAYGYFCAWVRERDPCTESGFPEVVSARHVRAFIDSMTGPLAPLTICGILTDLAEFGRVAWPDESRSHLKSAICRLRYNAQPSRNKRARMVGVDALLKLGISLMERAYETDHSDSRIPLAKFRDGLSIALLAARPLRIRAFGSLQLDHHLIRQGSSWRLVVPTELSKTRKYWEARVPEHLCPWLDRYLEEIRPKLLALRGRWYAPPGDAVWISVDGSAMRPKALGEAITKRTKAKFGHAVSPHLFRDEAVTELALTSPADVRIATPLLGHSSQRTTEQHYNHAETIDAARKYHAAQKALRRRLMR